MAIESWKLKGVNNVTNMEILLMRVISSNAQKFHVISNDSNVTHNNVRNLLPVPSGTWGFKATFGGSSVD